jgi:hypothetical protein
MKKVKLHPDNHIEIEIMLGEEMMLAELITHLARKAVEDKCKETGLDVDARARAYLRENKWRLRAEAEVILDQKSESRQ